jgi:hypothetical protein
MRSRAHFFRQPAMHRVLWLLLPALLLAQSLGLAHRTAHAGWSHSVAQFSSAQQQTQSQSWLFGAPGDAKQHSCAAFDAAAIGECVHHTPLLTVPVRNDAVLMPDTVAVVWHAYHERYFSSRAPPFS